MVRLVFHPLFFIPCFFATGPAMAQYRKMFEERRVIGQIFDRIEPVVETGAHGFFQLLHHQPIAFVLLALALGALIGKLNIKGISLGSTAGTLLVGIIISMSAEAIYGITYSIPGILSSFMLLLFMYALGLKVGPQFFSGLRKGGLAFMGIGIIVWVLNWVICYFGAMLVGLAPGYATGLISGSYTITAILGVGQGALSSGAYVPPVGMTIEEVGANMAAAYAISYVLSSIGIILLIRYLPRMFGRDAKADAIIAEAEYSGGAQHPVPGAPHALTMGFSPYDLRAFVVTHDKFDGRTLSQLAHDFPKVPILRVVRDGAILDLENDPVITRNDIVTVRANVHDLILEEDELIGPESDSSLARNVMLEVADIHVTSRAITGKTFEELARHGTAGVEVQALFRAGNELPVGPASTMLVGDVLRVTGPDIALKAAARHIGGHAILPTLKSEVLYLALAMLVGYLVGIVTVHISGIPFSLGTSAGCILAGVGVSYFRSRNPEFGGPVHEGARSFLQDFGLNAFVAVLSANVGPKVISALGGDTILWLALIGTVGALLPPFIAFWVGIKFFGLNSIIADGATTGGRNSTPGLNAIIEESGSSIAAVPYPVSYALTTVLALIGGYFSMILT
ncbi:transporter [Cobetia crustatorum]|uniref:Transporter n=1 Tax=Cobetia crustatorum TaxID=553385 RepID=A0A558HLY8_9GAMM|nr:transporter [Cobetia crustatorum]